MYKGNQMKEFTQFIATELHEAKNTHLEHIEDSLYNEGSAGVDTALAFLSSVTDMLNGNSKSKVNVTVKWDGAPAVFAGIHPETRKFFVGTKSIFNVVPKINYTNADIDKNHGDAPGLASKLKVALKYLGKLGIRGVLQGDIMFTNDDLTTEKIDGDKYVTFQPNTITYAVPVGSDIEKEISNAKIGVVWHTSYKGKTIKDMSASFNPKVSSLARTRDVWFRDADFKDTSGTATFTKTEQEDIDGEIANVEKISGRIKSFIDDIYSQSKLTSELKIYGNSLIRQGAGGTESAEGLINHINTKMQKAIDSVKTEAAKKRKESQFKELVTYLSNNSSKLDLMFALRESLVRIKMMLINKLKSVKGIGTFIKTGNGFDVTSPEGFVAVDRLSNKALKLVDRLEFSMQNFTASKNWDN